PSGSAHARGSDRLKCSLRFEWHQVSRCPGGVEPATATVTASHARPLHYGHSAPARTRTRNLSFVARNDVRFTTAARPFAGPGIEPRRRPYESRRSTGPPAALLTGFEPVLSAVTGRRPLPLVHRSLFLGQGGNTPPATSSSRGRS